jgi:hypothetical protein
MASATGVRASILTIISSLEPELILGFSIAISYPSIVPNSGGDQTVRRSRRVRASAGAGCRRAQSVHAAIH